MPLRSFEGDTRADQGRSRLVRLEGRRRVRLNASQRVSTRRQRGALPARSLFGATAGRCPATTSCCESSRYVTPSGSPNLAIGRDLGWLPGALEDALTGESCPSSTAAARNPGGSRPMKTGTRERLAGGRIWIRTVSPARIEQRCETHPFDLLTPHPFAKETGVSVSGPDGSNRSSSSAFRGVNNVGTRVYNAFAAQWLAYMLPYRRQFGVLERQALGPPRRPREFVEERDVAGAFRRSLDRSLDAFDVAAFEPSAVIGHAAEELMVCRLLSWVLPADR